MYHFQGILKASGDFESHLFQTLYITSEETEALFVGWGDPLKVTRQSVVEWTGILTIISASLSLSINPYLIEYPHPVCFPCLSSLRQEAVFSFRAIPACPLRVGVAQGTLRKQLNVSLLSSMIVQFQESENDSS